MTTPLTHPSTDTIPRCGWCDQKLSDAQETLSNLDLVEQVFIMIFLKYKVEEKINNNNSYSSRYPPRFSE